MVRKVEKDKRSRAVQKLHNSSLHAPRQNEKATDLYQMLRITKPAIDGRCKRLDTMCFPDLFPFRDALLKGSATEAFIQITSIQDFDSTSSFWFSFFTKWQSDNWVVIYTTSSKWSALMKELQLHVILKCYNMKKLKVTWQCIHRLQNSEQFWLKPRNDLIVWPYIMVQQHGFLHLVPVSGHGITWVSTYAR